MTSDDTNQLVENLFRDEYGHIVSILVSTFGVDQRQLVEDVVQDTLLKAMQIWSYKGVPNTPRAWLLRVAKNRAIDLLRRETLYTQKLPLLDEPSESLGQSHEEDQLAMLFMACHPALSQPMQVTLLLKTLGGLSVAAIARGLLLPDSTVAQRIVRAKRKLKAYDNQFTAPSADDIRDNLETVLLVIYAVFSEGYRITEGDHLVQKEICYKAIHLCELLLRHPRANLPVTHALMALMLFQVSRLDARVDAGALVLLSEQDRTRWHSDAIQLGFYHLGQARQGNQLSEYHLLAGISSCHAVAPDYDATDWEQILYYYDRLVELRPTPLFHLNRLVAVAEVDSVRVALSQVLKLKGLETHYLYHATLAEFYRRLGHTQDALTHYKIALKHTRNSVEQSFFESKMT